MANLDGFDASQVDPDVGFEPLPKNDYEAILTESMYKDTKSGNGRYLQLTWEIITGEYKKRIIFDRLNLDNPNKTAVKIAQARLSAICHAVGILRPKDSAELHNKPVIVSVGLEERDDRPGEYSNNVTGYKGVGDAPKATTEATAIPEDKALPPWKRK